VDVLMFLPRYLAYFLHDPLNWAEKIARALMVTRCFWVRRPAVGRAQHVGIDSSAPLFPGELAPAMIQLCDWIIVRFLLLLFSSAAMLIDSRPDHADRNCPNGSISAPVVAGSLLMIAFEHAAALDGRWKHVWGSWLPPSAGAGGMGLKHRRSRRTRSRRLFAGCGFVVSLVIGVPIAIALAFSSLLYFLVDPFLADAGVFAASLVRKDHFVLLAIPFFVLAV